MEPVYLDHNASAPIRPEAAEAVARALGIGANPSSIHARGRAARSLIETARGTVARFVGADPQALVFTSGGAEANALAIESAIAAGFAPLIIGTVEHETVIETARASGAEVYPLAVDKSGRADIDGLRAMVTALNGRRPFVALMLANNENGVIQPIAEAAQIVRAANGWLHVDAVQAAGKIAIDMNAAWRRLADLVGAQARRTPGRGRLGVGTARDPDPASARRRARARPARGHRKPGRHRRLCRGCGRFGG